MSIEKEKAHGETKRTLAKDENKTKKLLAVIEGIDSKILRDEFIRLQKDDESLKIFWDRSHTQEAYKELKLKEANFIVKADVLYRQYKHTDGIITRSIEKSSSQNGTRWYYEWTRNNKD